MAEFDYGRAFSRNLGWVTPQEQERLRNACVAIAGMGGVGGSHLLTLTRLGIGHFRLSDFDTFEVENFNRQAGARMSTVGCSKLDTLVAMALDINPELKITKYPEGVNASNVAEFLDSVDVYVDGLDFFALNARAAVFACCHRLGIPAVTAAPLGMGAALLNFLPGQMSFEEYFRLNDADSEEEQFLRFFIGLAPRALQQHYLVSPEFIDLPARKGPSTAMGCEMCAGVAATQVLKIITRRGHLKAAPYGIHYDAFLDRTVTTWRPFGNRNPLHRLMIKKGKEQMLGHG